MISKEKENQIQTFVNTERKGNAEYIKQLESLTIESQEEYDTFGEILKDLNTNLKKIEEERKSVVGPLNAVVTKVNGWFKPPKDDLTSMIKTIKRKLSDYILEQKAKQEALQLEALAQKDSTLLQKSEDLQIGKVKGISSKVVWNFEIVNEALLERKHLMPDLEALNEEVQRMKDQTNIPAIRVYKDVQIRAGSNKKS